MNLHHEFQSQLWELLGDQPSTITPIAGATSSDLFLLKFPDRRLVLRLFKNERWECTTRSLTERELKILTALAITSIPVPAPIGTLPENGVVMSWLAGSVILPRLPDNAWINELAQTLSQLHRCSIEVPYRYESWNDVRGHAAPSWWQSADVWNSAQEISLREPDYAPRFIHRDYHPVNVLWIGERISGVVDWINACMGPVGIDIAHCRLNLAVMYGQAIADQFLHAYIAHNQTYTHDPYWDLDDALGALPDVEPYPPWEEFGLTGLTTDMIQDRLQYFVRSAVNAHQAR